jgi:hypothetical protein
MRVTQLFGPAWSKCGRYLGALLGLLALPACSEPGCDVCTTSAIIYGRVVDANSVPVVGAGVGIEAHRENCSTADIPAASDQGLTTGANGNYRARLRSPFGPFTACPRVTVESPSGLPGPVTVEGSVVEFLDDFGSNLRRDSVRVDVVFPAAAD